MGNDMNNDIVDVCMRSITPNKRKIVFLLLKLKKMIKTLVCMMRCGHGDQTNITGSLLLSANQKITT